jgi:hypothetical protein
MLTMSPTKERGEEAFDFWALSDKYESYIHHCSKPMRMQNKQPTKNAPNITPNSNRNSRKAHFNPLMG